MAASDSLRDAIQAHIRATTGTESTVVTDYALVAAHIDLHAAPGDIEYTTTTEGALHSVLGLADILTDSLTLEDDA